MIQDYDVYLLNGKEKVKFIGLGYCVVTALSYLFYKSVILSLIAGGMIFLFRKFYEKSLAEKRKQLLQRQFKDLLYSISVSLSTGRNMPQALKEGLAYLRTIYSEDSPMVIELKNITDAVYDKRQDEVNLINDLAKRSNCVDIANFAEVYSICRNTGGNMEKVVQRASSIISDKMEIEAEIKALSAQKKVEGKVITVIPLVVLAALNIMSPDYVEVLYCTLTGRLIMTMAVAGIVGAYVIIEKILSIEV